LIYDNFEGLKLMIDFLKSSFSVNLALTLPSLGLGIKVLIKALLVKNLF
jgi:hypothetical protein